MFETINIKKYIEAGVVVVVVVILSKMAPSDWLAYIQIKRVDKAN